MDLGPKCAVSDKSDHWPVGGGSHGTHTGLKPGNSRWRSPAVLICCSARWSCLPACAPFSCFKACLMCAGRAPTHCGMLRRGGRLWAPPCSTVCGVGGRGRHTAALVPLAPLATPNCKGRNAKRPAWPPMAATIVCSEALEHLGNGGQALTHEPQCTSADSRESPS
jgi:hypothetical protein